MISPVRTKRMSHAEAGNCCRTGGGPGLFEVALRDEGRLDVGLAERGAGS